MPHPTGVHPRGPQRRSDFDDSGWLDNAPVSCFRELYGRLIGAERSLGSVAPVAFGVFLFAKGGFRSGFLLSLQPFSRGPIFLLDSVFFYSYSSRREFNRGMRR
jgi:hypothetical protein